MELRAGPRNLKAFFLLAFLFTPPVARANYISYVDDKGTKHIVESASEIPEKYRPAAKKTTAGMKVRAETSTATDSATTTSEGRNGAVPAAPPAAPSAQPVTP